MNDELRLDGPVPIEPPCLIPWNGFDPEGADMIAEACRVLAKKLSDDEWHGRSDLLNYLIHNTPLNWATSFNLLTALREHGDIREQRKMIRLTTRFRP